MGEFFNDSSDDAINEAIDYPVVKAHWDNQSPPPVIGEPQAEIYLVWEQAGAAEFIGMLPLAQVELYQIEFDLPPQEWIEARQFHESRSIPVMSRKPLDVLRLAGLR